jgi:hypothetical protein
VVDPKKLPEVIQLNSGAQELKIYVETLAFKPPGWLFSRSNVRSLFKGQIMGTSWDFLLFLLGKSRNEWPLNGKIIIAGGFSREQWS